MSISVPSAGSPILDTWGVAVADQLNRTIIASMTADQATDSATAVNVTELVVPVVAGRVYQIEVSGEYSPSATNQGLKLGYTGPAGGAGPIAVRIWGGSGTTTQDNWRTYDGSITGNTATAAAADRPFWASIRYECATTGNLTIQFARGGTSGSTGITLKKGTALLAIEGRP